MTAIASNLIALSSAPPTSGRGTSAPTLISTAPLDDDLAIDQEDQSQILARFDTICDGDDGTDGDVLSRDLLKLSVTYLHR